MSQQHAIREQENEIHSIVCTILIVQQIYIYCIYIKIQIKATATTATCGLLDTISAIISLFSFLMTSNLKKKRTWVSKYMSNTQESEISKCITYSFSHEPYAVPPSTHLSQEEDFKSPCSEFSRFRSGYTQQHGDIICWGQPWATISHQNGPGHIGRGTTGQEKSAVGHLGLVACPLQRDRLE